MLDKAFYEEEVKRLCLSFEQQVCTSATEQPYPPSFVPLVLAISVGEQNAIPDCTLLLYSFPTIVLS